MKACLFDKVLLKQEDSLSVTAEPAHVGRSTKVIPTSLLWEGVGSHTQQKKPWAEKTERWYFPPAPLKPRTTQTAKAKTSRNQEGFIFPSSVLCYDKVTYKHLKMG